MNWAGECSMAKNDLLTHTRRVPIYACQKGFNTLTRNKGRLLPRVTVPLILRAIRFFALEQPSYSLPCSPVVLPCLLRLTAILGGVDP